MGPRPTPSAARCAVALTSRALSHATIVLKWTGPNNYYVLTSYPECRE